MHYQFLFGTMPALVHEHELLWVLSAVEPAKTRDVAPLLPIDQNSAYVRLRSLDRRGYLDHEITVDPTSSQTSTWWLTERGRERVADADLPPAEGTDFGEYFAGRTRTIDPGSMLEELAVHGTERDGGWVPSPALYDALPFSKMGIRKKLNNLREDGLVERATDRGGRSHHWRLTDAGAEFLEDTDTGDATPAWLSQ
jgi:predicted ArsR family transcriptional regulator